MDLLLVWNILLSLVAGVVAVLVAAVAVLADCSLLLGTRSHPEHLLP
jgi:hypothetical protein